MFVSHQALVPDPILKLRRVVGFGGCETKDVSVNKLFALKVYVDIEIMVCYFLVSLFFFMVCPMCTKKVSLCFLNF